MILIVSDADYDALMRELQQLEQQFPKLGYRQQIHPAVGLVLLL